MTTPSEWLSPAEGFAAVAQLDGLVTVESLFDILARAAHDVAEAIRAGDGELGEHACSALLNCLAMFPESMRDDMRSSLNREDLADHLREIAL